MGEGLSLVPFGYLVRSLWFHLAPSLVLLRDIFD
jgi:hypothetical protein